MMSYGTSKGTMFLNEYPGLAKESFRAFLNWFSIQCSWNRKADACGVSGRRMHYSKVKQGIVKMEGMPPGFLLRHPSSYEPRQLRAIYAAKMCLDVLLITRDNRTGPIDCIIVPEICLRSMEIQPPVLIVL
ncbi:uncharacterized protein [Apostichopus japonicus]|uniref:uncharacterized protein n=1 Tax=Stichopus japonicus TaxID=307972 RepID=UPI003AB6474F